MEIFEWWGNNITAPIGEVFKTHFWLHHVLLIGFVLEWIGVDIYYNTKHRKLILLAPFFIINGFTLATGLLLRSQEFTVLILGGLLIPLLLCESDD